MNLTFNGYFQLDINNFCYVVNCGSCITKNITKDLIGYGLTYGIVDKFEGNHYMVWRFKMEMLLKARELWGLIDDIEVTFK
jgi:hypothetical protein